MNIKYKWVAMLGSFYVDSVGILFGWLLPVIFGSHMDPIKFIWVGIGDFQHSLFVIIPFFLLLLVEKRYFYAAVAGAYSHLFLDVFAHRTLPKLFFPFSEQAFTLYITQDFDPRLAFGMNSLLLAMLLYFEWKGMSGYILKCKKRLNHFKTLATIAVLFVSIVGVVYIWRVFRFDLEFLISFAIPLFTINLMASGVLFTRDLQSDDKVGKWGMKLLKRLNLLS